MGLLINGRWDADASMIPIEDGRFVREPAKFRDVVTADGSSGFPAARGRYHLYVAYHCPWAWRTILYRALKGLEDVISMTVAIPNDRREGWIPAGVGAAGIRKTGVFPENSRRTRRSAALPRISG